MSDPNWRRYAAPAAFLLAATIAILLIRSGLHAGGPSATTGAAPSSPRRTVSTTTKRKTKTTRTTSKTSSTAVARRFWTVGAGDTFGVISSKTGVPVATLERLNPRVKSTSLFIGQKIRLR
ncbi:MAG: LysM peptidoglycan-binding domain-containing protein [Gaiellaceae bacterium]